MVSEYNEMFFAAANTPHGFQSYFDEIFDPDHLERIYVIKGGPGTGKSGMMKSLAAAAEANGISVQRFACSSDPNSLDGILLPEKKIAMLDGTSPHTVDPVYPGVVESIVYTGGYWNKKMLLSSKAEIISLIRDGKRFYRRAYRFLAAAGEICGEMQNIAMKNLDEGKMQALIDRLARRLFNTPQSGTAQVRIQSSFNRNGLHRLHTFADMAQEIYLVRDHHYTALRFMDLLVKKAKEKKQDFFYSRSCLFPEQTEAVYFPATGIAFLPEDEETSARNMPSHVINMQRFTDKQTIRDNLQKLRFGKKCAETLFQGATDAFREASFAHDKLEKFYVAAMDFQGVTTLAKELEKEFLA